MLSISNPHFLKSSIPHSTMAKKEKRPSERYQEINNIINRESSAQSLVKGADLARRLGISLRQLRTDMEVMREELGAPLHYDRKLKSWCYTEGFDFIDKIPMRGQDVLLMRIAIETLSKGGQLKDFESIPAIFQKIYRASRRWVGDKATEKAIYFDPTPPYDGAKHLAFFLDAIETSRKVTFVYQAFGDTPPKTHVFDPYFLRHYDRRWYVGGYCHPPENLVRTFPLERIQGEPTIVGFFHDKPLQYNAESYWKDIYGITVPPKAVIEEVILKFNPVQAKYFLHTPFYQQYDIIEQSETGLMVRLRIIPNFDLTQKLASLGDQVRVLAPSSLVKTMEDFHRKALEQYLQKI
jgi:predicted DNA-binding transcriptional regulator YafY